MENVLVRELPELNTKASGRRWVRDKNVLWLVGRGGARLGYIHGGGDRWSVAVQVRPGRYLARTACWSMGGDRFYRSVMPDGWRTEAEAAEFLLETLRSRRS